MGIDLEFCQSNIQGIIKFEELSERIQNLANQSAASKKGEAELGLKILFLYLGTQTEGSKTEERVK